MDDFKFYFAFGWEHIVSLDALDHLLFITALAAIYMLRDWKQVIILITAFTVGHSISLALSSLNMISFPSVWVEFLVPLTIIITAAANFFQKTFTVKAIRLNYFLALFFGLIHGMAFANLLTEILASDQNFALAMVSFSLGLESGQVLVVIIVLLLAQLFVRMAGMNRRAWVFVLSGIALIFSFKMAWERLPEKSSQERQHISMKKAMENNIITITYT